MWRLGVLQSIRRRYLLPVHEPLVAVDINSVSVHPGGGSEGGFPVGAVTMVALFQAVVVEGAVLGWSMCPSTCAGGWEHLVVTLLIKVVLDVL